VGCNRHTRAATAISQPVGSVFLAPNDAGSLRRVNPSTSAERLCLCGYEAGGTGRDTVVLRTLRAIGLGIMGSPSADVSGRVVRLPPMDGPPADCAADSLATDGQAAHQSIDDA